jgi:hypothetical protein
MNYPQIEPERYGKLLEKDAATIQMNIVDYVRFLRKDHRQILQWQFHGYLGN